MKGILFILLLQNFAIANVHCQAFTVDELITLAHSPSKNIDHYLNKKGFALSGSGSDSGMATATFIQKIKSSKKDTEPRRTININLKEDAKYFTLHTTALNEFVTGKEYLNKAGFFYNDQKEISKEPFLLFQKENITIQAATDVKDGVTEYSFILKARAIPTSLRYAEDLLQFDSHEFLVSFFGVQNVKKDMYYFSEKELKKCSVLFSGTRRQAVFVWGDDIYLNNLSYILVTNILPTQGARNSNPLSENNEWELKNGIYPGMALKDLLKINETDFDIYGNKSELAFLVKPNQFGKIDFRKTAVMLSCHECFDNKIFNQKVVSAAEVQKANLPMLVFDVAIYPPNQ